MDMMAMISVTVCLCTFEYESDLFLKLICLQEFVSSSAIGQNIVKGPAICKHRQIFQGHCGEQDSGPLVREKISCWPIGKGLQEGLQTRIAGMFC